MNRILAVVCVVIGAFAIGCGGKGVEAPERLPDEEVPAYREAVAKLMPYIVLEDSAYRLTISEDDAARLGVPEKYYERTKRELEYTNYLVREEYNSKGIPVDMTDWASR